MIYEQSEFWKIPRSLSESSVRGTLECLHGGRFIKGYNEKPGFLRSQVSRYYVLLEGYMNKNRKIILTKKDNKDYKMKTFYCLFFDNIACYNIFLCLPENWVRRSLLKMTWLVTRMALRSKEVCRLFRETSEKYRRQSVQYIL